MENSAVISSYLKRVHTVPKLSRDEEFTLVAEARRGAPETAERLVRTHVAFVIRVAMDYRGRGVAFEDLVHEGCVGLLKAIRRFDPANGARFITYAAFWIRKAILEAISDGGRLVRVPRYQRVHGRPTMRELRFDDPISADDPRTLLDTLEDERGERPDAAAVAQDDVRRLRRHLRALPLREQAVLASRYGLDGETPMTLMEVGTLLSLSRERVRQIESAALAQLRKAMTKKARR
ncbi:MAG TPA: sigma-70 family RNA polymerase sigma factor [Candidatus Polarisedimenticolaceae bacterium]|nr:sigma-70 family RNA polymerase sigma factor [Candidatus Polarisedimenticolaceae bacterium]